MSYDAGQRDAYVAGATEAVAASILNVTAGQARELEQWLAELAEWTGGEPPDAPHRWPHPEYD